MTDARTDDDLMLAFGRGDDQAFEVLYARWRKPLYRYLYHAVGERVLADDLYQDVWSRIIDARTKFRRGNGFKHWAFRIAHNRLIDHWRVLGRQPGSDVDALDRQIDDEQRAPDRQLEATQSTERLRAALLQLPPEQREAFLLQKEAGLSLSEIAEHAEVGRETVKSRLRYAVARLRNLLQPGPEAAGK
ncbi:MAG: sigma-70 family RNA polymerase sigma factor [Wenzhouxiangellaceae bacterium]|nr:sigma-70 family RNA polymerase sigma factor [Wenzhouxiangellaceae bacterium]